jgi:hypothetical protein
MHRYRVTKDTYINEFGCTAFLALTCPPDVPETYHISKELVAYLEALVAFSPYYRADAASMSGKMEIFYQQTLKLCKDFTYGEFHN